MKKIVVYCEVNVSDKKLENVSYELISKAYDLTLKAKELKQDEDYIVEAVALNDEIADDTHILNNIYEELLKGVYI